MAEDFSPQNETTIHGEDSWRNPTSVTFPNATETPVEAIIEDEAADHSRTKGSAKSLNKVAVRRIAAKVLEVEAAAPRAVAAVAGLLGAKPNPVDLTVAIMTADRAVTQPLKDIQATYDAAIEDQIGAVLALNAVSRNQLKAMWTTMAAVNGTTTQMPANERQALTSLFGQITNLSTEQEQLLEAASTLLRRS